MSKVVAIDLEYQKGFGLYTDFCRSCSVKHYPLPDEAFYIGDLDGHVVIYEQIWLKGDGVPQRPSVIGISHSEFEALDRIYTEKILERLYLASKYGHEAIDQTSNARGN